MGVIPHGAGLTKDGGGGGSFHASAKPARGAGSLMGCYLLKGTSARPLRCPRGRWGAGAIGGRPPTVASYPPQRSSRSALRGVHRAPTHGSCLISGTTVEGTYLCSIYKANFLKFVGFACFTVLHFEYISYFFHSLVCFQVIAYCLTFLSFFFLNLGF